MSGKTLKWMVLLGALALIGCFHGKGREVLEAIRSNDRAQELALECSKDEKACTPILLELLQAKIAEPQDQERTRYVLRQTLEALAKRQPKDADLWTRRILQREELYLRQGAYDYLFRAGTREAFQLLAEELKSRSDLETRSLLHRRFADIAQWNERGYKRQDSANAKEALTAEGEWSGDSFQVELKKAIEQWRREDRGPKMGEHSGSR